MRAGAGLHRADPVVRQHPGPAQEVGVLGRVDVVGDDADRQLAGQRPAQRGDQRGLAAADRSADADPRYPRARPGPAGVDVLVGVVVAAVHGVGQDANRRTSAVRWKSASRSSAGAASAGSEHGGPAAAAAASAAHSSTLRRQPGQHGLHGERIEAEQPHRRAGRPGARGQRRGPGGQVGCPARQRARRPRARAGDAAQVPRTSGHGVARSASEAPNAAGVAAPLPSWRDAARIASDGVRASNSASSSRGQLAAAISRPPFGCAQSRG